jgi:hypothetical protein
LDDLEDVKQDRAPRSEARVPSSELRVGEPTLMMFKSPPRVGPQLAATKNTTWISAGVGGGLLILASLAGFWMSHHRRIAGQPPAAASAIAASPASSPPSLTAAPRAPLAGPSSTEGKTRQTPNPGQLVKEAELKPRLRSRAEPGSQVSLAPGTLAPRPPAPSHPEKGTVPSKPSANNSGRVVQLVCSHDLENATLVVSSSSRIISQWPLKGRRKGGIFGIKSGRTGTMSRSLTIPAEVRELFVRVVSRDGSFDLSRRISAAPPAGLHPSLQVEVRGDHLTVSWKAPSRPKT